MKIASVIKPKNGAQRNVTIHGKLYIFKATEGKDETIHFVADVNDELHATTFMSQPAFYQFGADHAPVVMLKRADPPAPPAPQEGAAVTHKPADIEAATEMLKGSAAEISKAIAHSNADIIQAALDIELANATPRKNVSTVLTMALEGIKTAGPQR